MFAAEMKNVTSCVGTDDAIYRPVKSDCNRYILCKNGKIKEKSKCPVGWIFIPNAEYNRQGDPPCQDPRGDTPDCYKPRPTKTPPVVTSKLYLAYDETFIQCCFDAGPTSQTGDQHPCLPRGDRL